eukprot:m.159513 g.159513  ORF g.159513 m.159513 type:complete len:571 (+) comp38767_c0_seq16:5981-7693(+)
MDSRCCQSVSPLSVFLKMGNAETVPSREKSEFLYDVVLKCNPLDLCDDGQWVAEFPGKEISLSNLKGISWSGLTVGVLGNFNRGKTWIMSRLVDYQLPGQGMTASTEGLSLKWAAFNNAGSNRGHIVIDTAGINSPIHINDSDAKTTSRETEGQQEGAENKKHVEKGKEDFFFDLEGDKKRVESFRAQFQKKVQQSMLYEDFLQTMTLQLSDCIIVVMAETTYLDQGFLHRVLRNWKELCTTDLSSQRHFRNKHVYVVHNFFETKDPDQRDKLFEISTSRLYPGDKGKTSGKGNKGKDSIPIFCCHQDNFKTRHVCLMDDKYCSGYNDDVFEMLRDWIDSGNAPATVPFDPDQFIRRFLNSSTAVVRRGYLQNVKQISHKVDKEKNQIIFFPEKESGKKIKSGTTSDDRLYGALIGFQPAVKESTYETVANKQCKLIQLEVPGVEPSSIKIKKQNDESEAQCQAVIITGEKKKLPFLEILTDLLPKMEFRDKDTRLKKLLPSTTPLDKHGDDNATTERDSCRYGDFSRRFQIPLGFDCKGNKFETSKGVVLLAFEEKEAESSSDSSDSSN